MSDTNGEANLVEWVLNGEPVKSPAGTTILEAAKAHNADLPHFCYHPGLSIAGNCRICLVETNRSPKPVISCSERISPGLEVQTHSDMAVEAREGVMEFQLINHPLDCPVCDKAGECVLQDYSYEHGPDRSRFVEQKNISHTKDLGPTIKLWGNRCIVCTRCVRFTDEISGTGELCVTGRGDHSQIDVFPGTPIDNALAGNVVDICPVGALISKDFLFQSRVWNVRRTDSVCAGCSRGCNVEVEANEGFLKRLMPRENADVNEWWICDHGRYDYRYPHDASRRTSGQFAGEDVRVSDATKAASDLIAEAKANDATVGLVVDPFMTCEELELARSLAEATGATVGGWMPAPGKEETFPKGFRISGEKAPNRAGAEAIFGSELFSGAASKLAKDLDGGKIDLLVAFAGFPHADPVGELVDSVSKSKKRVVFNLFDGAWSEGADVVLPSASPFEKDGVYVNEDGRAQRVRTKDDPSRPDPQPGLDSASKPTVAIEPEFQILQSLLIDLGERDRTLSPAGVFRQLSTSNEKFEQKTHHDVGSQGVSLSALRGGAVGVGGEA